MDKWLTCLMADEVLLCPMSCCWGNIGAKEAVEGLEADSLVLSFFRSPTLCARRCHVFATDLEPMRC